MEMKKYLIGMTIIAATLLTTACRDSRRDEIEQRREALKHKQDSSLEAAQRELALVDSTLEAVKAEFERKKTVVEAHRAALKATKQELTELTQLRVKRDSLQMQWNMLGAKIKYIRVKMKEL